MSDLMESLRPQIDAMNDVYRAAYKAGIEEGKRQAFKIIFDDLKLMEIERCRPV
jgi:hypothetical protein